MASLNKLAIRGIRSFDDKQISIIEFFSPVTVIVGHNGSGKTTIIECLKYATTGDQPPNTRGGAFVHDPKMANEKEVKAQVKLRFHAANGTRMLAVRNLSVSVKKTAGLTMKTLESILALADGNADKGGKRGVISTKCAEMDAEIPQLLGVSKSVLENVIFCHQEDSYWPLAEPAALKKKFDDIFEATRYTKALDSIKALRKDRVAELKAEKERLQSLSLEKSHADKLKTRISDLNATIATKEVEYEATKKQYDSMVEANQKFYDYATKFREVYLEIKNLEENKKRFEAELEEARLNLQEVVGTDDELAKRLENFDEHISAQKEKRKAEDRRKEELEDELDDIRKEHTDLAKRHGQLAGEAEAQTQRLAERERLIRTISEKHGIKGYDVSPLDREKVLEFISRLADIQRKQKLEFEKRQADNRAKTDEYNRKIRQLDNELSGYKLQKSGLRDQIAERQTSITALERSLDTAQSLPSELHTLAGDIEEKKARIEKIKADIKAANYDERLAEQTTRAKLLDDQKDALNTEFRSLNLQVDLRTRLELKRGEIKNKNAEVKNILETANAKFRKLTDSEAKADTIAGEVEKISLDKERELAEMENDAAAANKTLTQAELKVSNLKVQAKTKKDELKALEKKLKVEIEQESLEIAIKEAADELSHRNERGGNMLGASTIYETLLRVGKQKKLCTACNRHLDDHEMIVFERYLKDQMKKTSPESVALNKEETKEWAEELDRLQGLRPVEASRNRLKDNEIPALEQDIKNEEAAIPAKSAHAEEALNNLNDLKRELKDIQTLKQQAESISRLQKELERLRSEVSTIESDLSVTGSTKTADVVEAELQTLSEESRTIDKEKQNLANERERQNNAVRKFESDLHNMQLRERDLTRDIRDKKAQEERVEKLKKEVITLTSQLKEMDVKISGAQNPIDRLEDEHQRTQREVNAKILETQRLSEELNKSVDTLDQTNKAVERYVRAKGARLLQECGERIEQIDIELRELDSKIEGARQVISNIDKEVSASGASIANLRENIRVRKLVRDIKETQAKIDSHDMEEVARARRNFQEKYNIEKEKENNLHTSYSHIAGELSSRKDQLKTWEKDLKEFKDINKRYTDQLIRVKMSDMANSDLEKYAKALDNAIMKYHGLKMEEVNDTMRHLWNKTYQGTDIDGIKIRSDVEGGASKRSYNYRVVMTKDQVEMDMRGRCSAGQKMLASIIIRLALSDSFGQNCGILALDEPTNALDTENIDALAASLVDIINERKNHSNFQLIIITHDENFLRKLGQSDVMEYYWRVSRDSRQKSVIERQRFR